MQLGFAQKVSETNTAIDLLNRELPDTAIQVIKNIPENELLDFFNSSDKFRGLVDNRFFKSYKTSPLERTFKKQGLTENRLTLEVILRAYKRNLLGQDQNLDQLIETYSAIERKWDQQSANIATTDTLRGTYIPLDLEDCWRILDLDLGEETKSWILEQNEKVFLAASHLSMGSWIRNNWGLWAGSRLSHYFIERGVEHPEGMSGIILSTYYQYLKGEEINIDLLFNRQKKDE